MRYFLLLTALILSSLSQVLHAQTLMVLGDSLSAGYGLKPEQGWVRLLEQRLDTDHSQPVNIINASISGETTGGALNRLPKLLEQHQPDILLIELGGNDGLRGNPLQVMQRNLETMIDMAKARSIQIVLVGMQIPPNYGPRYTQWFEDIFQELAREHQLPLVERWLEPVGGNPQLMQADGIHPTAEAQPLLLQPILNTVLPLLNR